MNNLQTVYSISIAPVKQASDQLDNDATMLAYANGFVEMADKKYSIFGDPAFYT